MGLRLPVQEQVHGSVYGCSRAVPLGGVCSPSRAISYCVTLRKVLFLLLVSPAVKGEKERVGFTQGVSNNAPPHPDPLSDSYLPCVSWENALLFKILTWSSVHQRSTEHAIWAGMLEAHPQGLSAPELAFSLLPVLHGPPPSVLQSRAGGQATFQGRPGKAIVPE